MTEFQAGDIVEVLRDSKAPCTEVLKKGEFYRLGPSTSGEYVHVGRGLFPREFYRLAFRPPAGEVWEPWNGGDAKPPTPFGAVVMRNGKTIEPVRQWNMRWTHDDNAGDIIAYRVIPAEDAVSGYEVRAGGPLDGAAGSIRTHTEAGGRKVEIGPSADTENCRRIQVDGAQWCKVYGWSSEEAQERAEAIAVALSLFDAAAPAASIDPDKIKVGDEVTIRGVVNSTKDIDGTFQVIVDGQYTAYAPASAIVGHTPKVEPLKAGDRVMALWPGELKFISGLYGWVLPDHDPEPAGFLLSDLTRIEDPS